jgi:hypothetical protein
MMLTVTRKEEAELELLGAQRRLDRAEAELEFFFARHGDGDATERHLLEVERDEAQRQVIKCRLEVDSL